MKVSLLRLIEVSICFNFVFYSSYSISQEVINDEDNVEVILVTAQKRVERLIDVPISVTSINKSQIAERGIKELKELASLSPNLIISQGTDFNTKITIRGVGAHSRNIGFDSRVGVYIDGVYMGQSPAINQGLGDFERIEVLRGPQGTLFGKNSIAGAISLISQQPSDEFQTSLAATIGNYDLREYHLQSNIPFTAQTKAIVFLNTTKETGYVTNQLTKNKVGGNDSSSGRVHLFSELASDLTVSVTADFLNKDRLGFENKPLSDPFGNHPVNGPFGDLYKGTADDKYLQYMNNDVAEDKQIWGSALTLNYQLSNDFSLKSISAYRDTKTKINFDIDYSSLSIIDTLTTDSYKQLSQEFQLLSPDDEDFSYILGLYLYQLDSTTLRDANGGEDIVLFGDPRLQPDRLAVSIDGDVKTQSYALFGNTSYAFTDKLTLGLGVRYNQETKEVDWTIDGSNSGFFGIATGAVKDKRTDTNFSPAINVNYALTPYSQTYLRLATGFKSGGYNLDYITADAFASGIEFNDETVISYELGYKAQLLNNRLNISGALFKSIYDDYQVNQFVDLGDGRTALSITNAAEVKTQGIELELNYQLSDDLAFNMFIGGLSAKFDKFPGGGTGGSDASGNKLPNAPKLTASFGVQYYQSWPAIASTLNYKVDYHYTGSKYFNVNNDSNYEFSDGSTVDYGKVGSSKQLSARISLTADNGAWEIGLWGKNLTNSDHMVRSFRDFFGTILAGYAKPRSYGVETTFYF
jgi:Outer membrane receptor proteins, mostly Fe transport